MNDAYEMSTAAEADLHEIIYYTASQWGVEQARTYAHSLQRCASTLATGRSACKNLDALYSNLRMVRCEHHYIFGLLRPHAAALIIAILHKRMDLIARVTQRLTY